MGASQCQGCASDAIVADHGREASGRPTVNRRPHLPPLVARA